jgi:alginate O-acetyltransferase complex protein AlgJ
MKTAAALLANTIGEEFSDVQSATYHAVDSTVCHRGDIYSMLRLAKKVNWIPAEEIKTETVLDAAGLFHSRQKQAEILLLGDSFTNIYSVANMGWGRAAGLAEHLSLLLQCPIDVISRNDGGSYATRQMLRDDMAKGNDRLAGKKVIIWQFAMRELSTGNWETMNFDLGQVSDSPQYLSIEEGTVLTTEATVADVATIPHPSTVTYEDHVVAVHLTDIEGQPGKEALVYMLAMEKRQLLPAANIRPGDRIALTMENWGSHEAVEGAFNRSELESDITFMAEPVWATLNNK